MNINTDGYDIIISYIYSIYNIIQQTDDTVTHLHLLKHFGYADCYEA